MPSSVRSPSRRLNCCTPTPFYRGCRIRPGLALKSSAKPEQIGPVPLAILRLAAIASVGGRGSTGRGSWRGRRFCRAISVPTEAVGRPWSCRVWPSDHASTMASPASGERPRRLAEDTASSYGPHEAQDAGTHAELKRVKIVATSLRDSYRGRARRTLRKAARKERPRGESPAVSDSRCDAPPLVAARLSNAGPTPPPEATGPRRAAAKLP